KAYFDNRAGRRIRFLIAALANKRCRRIFCGGRPGPASASRCIPARDRPRTLSEIVPETDAPTLRRPPDNATRALRFLCACRGWLAQRLLLSSEWNDRL